MKIVFAICSFLLLISLTGCGSSETSEPESQLPPEIQDKHDAKQRDWDKGFEDATKGKNFGASVDAYNKFKREHGDRPAN